MSLTNIYSRITSHHKYLYTLNYSFTLFGHKQPIIVKDNLAFTPDGMNQFGLTDVKGEPWRKMKRQLTPSFSVPRLKKNVETMNEVASQLTGYLHSIENREYVEVMDVTKKYFLNCIASIGFGLRIDCFGGKKSAFENAAE